MRRITLRTMQLQREWLVVLRRGEAHFQCQCQCAVVRRQGALCSVLVDLAVQKTKTKKSRHSVFVVVRKAKGLCARGSATSPSILR